MDAISSSIDYLTHFGLDLRMRLGATWLGIDVWQYAVAAILFLVAFFARRAAGFVLDRLIVPWVGRIGGGLGGRILSVLVRPLTAMVGLLGSYLALRVLLYPAEPGRRPFLSVEFVDRSFEVAAAVIILWTAIRLIDLLTAYLRERAQEADLPVDVPVIPLLRKSLKIFIGLIGGLLIIQHLGYPIASLLGGLGIGGLAVALAAQDTLANVFGSIIIFADKPFKVGDWVQIGDVSGHVEAIGFRSTRIRTWPRSLVAIPNKTIANSQIENWSAMPKRRITFTLYVTYASTPEQIERLVDGIYEILRSHPGVDQEYYLVKFTEFAQEGFGIFIYYFTRSTVWAEHLQVRQEVNLEILRLVRELGMTVAVPSRRIYVSAEASELQVAGGDRGEA